MNRKCRRMAAAAVLLAGALYGQGGAGTAGEPTGFFAFYERNRQEQVPNYVTEDFLVRAYLLTLETAVTEYEEEHAAPALRQLLPRLRAELGSVTAAERVAQGYLVLLEALLAGRDAGTTDPPGMAAELARVRAAEGLAASPLLRQRLDYSKFRARGKYARDAELARYHQAVRMAGTALFPLLESRSTGISAEAADALTGAAWLMSHVLKLDDWAAALYERVIGPLDYVFGAVDAMSAARYAGIEIIRPGVGTDGWTELLQEPGADGWRGLRRDLFAKSVRCPRAFGSYVDRTLLEPGVGVADVLAGWQLLPGRRSPASAAFQELVHDRVGPYQGPAGSAAFTLGVARGVAVKAFPTLWELGALLGSSAAREHLERAGETEYAGYEEAYGRAGEALADAAGLAADHLQLLRVWLAGGSAERRLNTALGFWVQQRHGAAAYPKQSYTADGWSLPADRREQAWLEPAGELYHRLAWVARVAGSQLQSSRLKGYAALVERCANLAGKALEAEDVRFLNGLDRSLLRVAGRSDAPVAIDYHTDANAEWTVQAALGWPREVRLGGGRGALFSVYEFKRPAAERLDDEGWGRSLEEGAPADVMLPGATQLPDPVARPARAARGREWRSPLWMEFVRIPAGTFVMGSPEGEANRFDDERQREVRIDEAFYIGKYEVTQRQWEAVMGRTPWSFRPCGSRCPVVQVSFHDVQDFLRRLNRREWGSGYAYRLPSEAEWEYAARAGTVGARYGELGEIAWYEGNSGGTMHPVGEKRANAWGLHDMLGNVWEWTEDYVPSSDEHVFWVLRGGAYFDRNVRAAYREGWRRFNSGDHVGFRLVRTE